MVSRLASSVQRFTKVMNNPNIVVVGSRRYRVRTMLAGNADSSGPKSPPQSNSKAKQGKSDRITIDVPRQLHKYIVGARGSTLERLRQQTHAKITVPNERSKSNLIEIEGMADERKSAQEMINQLVADNMANVPYTHFISLPLADLDVQRKVGEFQREAHQRFLQNVDCTSFVQPGSLHITIGMLRLLSPAEVAKAVEFLKSLESGIRQVIGTRPLVATIGQLAAMESDPAQSRIIYAKAEDFDKDRRLEQLCRYVRSKFDEGGYIDEKRELKIHATVFRAKPARDSDPHGGQETSGKARSGFSVNAVPLLKEFKTLSFGVCRIGQIQIARRFRHNENGAYLHDGVLEL
ncbi:activating signal cointegrator 1 complex subunit [Coemansia sp. RSA 989]|nr:activating signal cointegrator 1 complex subunit [Coemansia sp. RSA 1086]KAJ1752399.1 activating signal cointegrator 1 complex subunit [Coemansia sp. RSA 1821]KAJ1866264.1 activating signal cointegrator 1 complex subunit [Coemansia sp. RSA 989]KAJ2627217.1 activating signal cointegrator 1 complex subunit [Coemansia sp. RSA 1290]KAJ2650017.1 activating signal cointegrator 1 complex subunit [Coemansia sp. RSA 1250]KAJ2672848.1 activating signal cointegrator 1 complex subunit [Coemansia sp. RS